MDYIKITATLEDNNEIAEQILIATLGDLGCDSFTSVDGGVVEAYIDETCFNEELLKSDDLTDNPLFKATFSWQQEKSVNWNSEWEQNEFQPIVIDDKVVIRAPFHEDIYAELKQIIIDPNMSFGTGDHQTTAMIVSMILEQDVEGKSVLDMGCGTGVLGIFAAKQGAKSVVSIDIDEWSYNSTLNNAKLNGVENSIEAKLGDAELLSNYLDTPFDIVYANIHKNILINDMDSYLSVMKSGSDIIFSGFYTSDIDSISDKATSLGLNFISKRERDSWTALLFRKG